MAGGVVGYAQNTRVAECTNTGGFNASNRNGRSGGIAGQAMNSQITGCVNRAMVVADGTGDANPANLGGLVGVLSKGSSMSDCRHYGVVYDRNYTSTTVWGGVAGVSVAGATIDNCGFRRNLPEKHRQFEFDRDGDKALGRLRRHELHRFGQLALGRKING